MAVFRWRHFAGEIILWAVRWYCCYGTSYRELEEMMGERGVAVDFVFHFTPTSCSWLNAVEGFFAKLTTRRLQRGVFCSIMELQAAINRFLDQANDNPKPFVWTADPDKIIAAVKRGHQALDSIH
jgi:hypothetical protein